MPAFLVCRLLREPMPDPEFQAALLRYARLRRLAYDAIEQLTPPSRAGARVRLADIDANAIEAWRHTWRHGHALGYGGWDWSVLVAPVWRRPAGLHLAVWSGESLCGLAVGRPSRRRRSGQRHTLSVHFLEGSPDQRHPLRGRIAPLALAAAESYAAVIGAWRLRLIDPLPGVLRIYQRLGFSIARKAGGRLCLEKRVEIDETSRF